MRLFYQSSIYMDFFSFNYKPKDFKKGDRDKTLPEILEMKPSKVSLDFFTKYEKEIAEAGLRPETISAIHFLSDLRNKGDIFDKCYKPGERTHMKQFSPDPVPMQQPPPVQEPVLAKSDERPLIENQEGGRRRHGRKHRSRKHRSKHSSGDHSECTHGGGKRTKHRSTRHKHRRSKHRRSKHRSTRHKHRRSKHRRTYKGGGFKGPTDVVNESNPAPALPAYKPVFDTSE